MSRGSLSPVQLVGCCHEAAHARHPGCRELPTRGSSGRARPSPDTPPLRQSRSKYQATGCAENGKLSCAVDHSVPAPAGHESTASPSQPFVLTGDPSNHQPRHERFLAPVTYTSSFFTLGSSHCAEAGTREVLLWTFQRRWPDTSLRGCHPSFLRAFAVMALVRLLLSILPATGNFASSLLTSAVETVLPGLKRMLARARSRFTTSSTLMTVLSGRSWPWWWW